SLALFRHIQERNDLYDALVGGRGLQVLFDAIQSALARNIQAQLQAMPQANAPRVPLPVVANAVAGTFLSLIKWWLDHKMPYSPEEMDEMFQRLVTPGVAEALANRD